MLFLTGIIGGVLLHFMDFNVVLKLGLVMFILMLMGAILVFKIDTTTDLNDID